MPTNLQRETEIATIGGLLCHNHTFAKLCVFLAAILNFLK